MEEKGIIKIISSVVLPNPSFLWTLSIEDKKYIPIKQVIEYKEGKTKCETMLMEESVFIERYTFPKKVLLVSNGKDQVTLKMSDGGQVTDEDIDNFIHEKYPNLAKKD